MTETVPGDAEMYYKTEAVTQGMMAAYARNKRPSGPSELVSSVLLAMNDPTAEQRWWHGENVFATSE